jgi:type IV pilus assembly protein PilM
MANKITTLYISDTSVRLMVTHGKRISKLADVPLDIEIAEVSAEDNEAELAAKIKHLITTNKIDTKRVIIGISGLHCLSRPAVLPTLPKAMQDEAMTREAKRLLPVPPEQLYISWQIAATDESKMRAFIVAIPRHIADSLLRVLDQVGMKPYMMDIKPLALSRLAKEATCIVIDVQPKEFDIVLLVDGIPQPMRSVAFPHDTLSPEKRLSIVKDELKRTIQFYNSNNPEKCIEPSVPIYVSGELAGESQSYESLSEEMGHPVSPLTSPLKCPKQLDPSHYLVNVGLTLKELPKEAGPLVANINTLPGSYLPKPLPTNKLMALPAAAAAIGVIILLAMTIQDAAAFIDSATNQLDSTNLQIEEKQARKTELAANIEEIEKELQTVQKQYDSFIAAHENIDYVCDKVNGDMVATVDNVVDKLSLITIGHSGENLQISGQASTEVEILEYARNLDNTKRFSEVTVSSITREQSTDNESSSMHFSLNLRLIGKEVK